MPNRNIDVLFELRLTMSAADNWDSAHALRAVKQFLWLETGLVKAAFSRHAHP